MTISVLSFVAVLAVVLIAGAALGFVAGRGQAGGELARSAAAAQATAQRLLQENEGLIARSRVDANIVQMLSPLAKQLDLVNDQVQRLESRTTAHHSEVVTQLRREAQVSRELSDTTASLNAALRTTTARGQWGEVQLRRIIEAAGMLERVDFDTQVGSAKFAAGKETSLRPDAIIHLPGDGHIAIDAKVPMDSYLLAMEIPAEDAASKAERGQLLARHAKAVRSHVNALVKRDYPGDFPDSPQVTVMFLPTESLLAEATSADPALLEHALSNGVVLASPSSLLAMLRAIASVWSSSAASHEAREVVRLGRELVDRIRVFIGHMDRLGKSLGTSVNHYNKAVSSLESRLLSKARELSSLDAQALREPGLLAGDFAQVRELRAPELAASAPSAGSPPIDST